LREYNQLHGDRLHLLQLLIENEISRLSVWQNTLGETSSNRNYPQGADRSAVSFASPFLSHSTQGSLELTLHPIGSLFALPGTLGQSSSNRLGCLSRRRCAHGRTTQERRRHSGGHQSRSISTQGCYRRSRSSSLPPRRSDRPQLEEEPPGPYSCRFVSCFSFFLPKLTCSSHFLHQWLLLWAAVPPVTAVSYFQPRFDNNPIVLQYAMRVLEQHPVQLTFFFVPQVVQALRTDTLGEFDLKHPHSRSSSSSLIFLPSFVQGYVERFIFETSKVSQLFCHQIIWNMKANCYKDDSASEVSLLLSYPQLEMERTRSTAESFFVPSARPHETHARPNGGSSRGLSLRRSSSLLRPRVYLLQRGY